MDERHYTSGIGSDSSSVELTNYIGGNHVSIRKTSKVKPHSSTQKERVVGDRIRGGVDDPENIDFHLTWEFKSKHQLIHFCG